MSMFLTSVLMVLTLSPQPKAPQGCSLVQTPHEGMGLISLECTLVDEYSPFDGWVKLTRTPSMNAAPAVAPAAARYSF